MTVPEMQKMLSSAYTLLCAFDEAINDNMEGDHPDARAVDRWLTIYEKETGLSANIEKVLI